MSNNSSEHIDEYFNATRVGGTLLDELLAEGWRHCGTLFFRYNTSIYEQRACRVLPLRVNLERYAPSKAQRKIWRQNQDLQVAFGPARVNDENQALFYLHKQRFGSGAPPSLYTYLSALPATVPCEVLMVEVRQAGQLLAASFMDVGETAVSSIYGMFHPEEARRSLGIYTMLLEIDWALRHGKQYYYQGYCYHVPSFYDYKLKFEGLEYYDWQQWRPGFVR